MRLRRPIFQPASLRERLLEVMRPWYATPGQPWDPLLLTTPSLDLAVAWGAASYGWLRHTGGRRIGGGTARSYYVGIERDSLSTQHSALSTVLCVLPRHIEENDEIAVPVLHHHDREGAGRLTGDLRHRALGLYVASQVGQLLWTGNRPMRARESRALLTSNEGFSVVAPISVIVPSST